MYMGYTNFLSNLCMPTCMLKYFPCIRMNVKVIAIGKMCWVASTRESESVSYSVGSDPLQFHGLQPTRLLCPWNSPGKNTGVGSHSLLQGIFLTQGLNVGLPHCRQILYHLSNQGSPQRGKKAMCLFSLVSHHTERSQWLAHSSSRHRILRIWERMLYVLEETKVSPVKLQ